MKKIILFFAACLLTKGASAQYAQHSVVYEKKFSGINLSDKGYPVSDMPPSKASGAEIRKNKTKGLNKTTSGGERWYSHRHMIDTINGSLMTNFVFFTWFDSTVKQVYNNGSGPFAGTVNYSSIAEVVDPVAFTLFNNTYYWDASTMVVGPTDDYVVDSINIVGAYVKNAGRPTNIIDTLIFSVAVDSSVYKHSKNETGWTFFGNYLNTAASGSKDTLYYPRIWTDSVGRAAFSTDASVPRIEWYTTLSDADRTLPGAGPTYTTKSYTFAVPGGGLHVPAGNHYAITCTFKSGDTWTANVDSVENFHVFMPVSGEALGNNTQMPYYYYDYNDINMSLLLFSNFTGRYEPTLLIEGENNINFNKEFHAIESHVSCSSCGTLDVKNVGSSISAYAYPNPASNEVYIPFKLKQNADVTVSITNMMGQLIKSQNIGNVNSGKAFFEINELVNGVYFYTISAMGERSTGRIIISH